MTEEDRRMLEEQRQEQQQISEHQEPLQTSQNNLNNSSSNFSNDYQPDNIYTDSNYTIEDEEEPPTKPADDEISVDDSLPSDWIPLVDPSSGDTYFCNEVTGETTWDKPQFDEEERERRRKNKSLREKEEKMDDSDQPLELPGGENDDDDDDEPISVEEEELPEGWFSIVDPDSGDVYYSNEITGETTW